MALHGFQGLGVLVDDDHLVSFVREPCGKLEAYFPRANYNNAHGRPTLLSPPSIAWLGLLRSTFRLCRVV